MGYFLILTILPLRVLSYSAFINGRDSTEERVMAHLTSIADMKKSEIEGWLEERIADTKDHANNQVFVEYLRHNFPKETPLTPEETLIESSVYTLLSHYKENYAYEEVYVTDARVVDEMRILQVLVNYVSNANKYSEESKVIRISIQDIPDGLRIRVEDEGIGIKQVDIEKLFKPFPDIDMDHVRRGTGLGLSICKGIIDLHGRQVGVESAGKGMGSTFSFVIPVTIS